MNVTEKQIKKLIRKLDLARSTVFVSAWALDGGDTDLELQSATALKKAHEIMDRVYSTLLSMRIDLRDPRAGEPPATAVFTDGLFVDRPPIAGLPCAKPCPFCGSDNDIFITQVGEDDPHFRAACGICGVDAPGGPTEMDAVSGWNTRGKLYEVAERPS